MRSASGRRPGPTLWPTPWRLLTPAGKPVLWPVWGLSHLTWAQAARVAQDRQDAQDPLAQRWGDRHPLTLLPAGFGIPLGAHTLQRPRHVNDEDLIGDAVRTPEWRGITPLGVIPPLRGDTLLRARLLVLADHLTGARATPPKFIAQGTTGAGWGHHIDPQVMFLAVLGLSAFPCVRLERTPEGFGLPPEQFQVTCLGFTDSSPQTPFPTQPAALGRQELHILAPTTPITWARWLTLQRRTASSGSCLTRTVRAGATTILRYQRTAVMVGRANSATFTLREATAW